MQAMSIPGRVTAWRALAQVHAILCAPRRGEHSPAAVPCPPCRAFWTACLDAAERDNTREDDLVAATLLAGLVAVLPPPGHPAQSCVDCEGCVAELEMGAAAVALGHVGLPEMLAWGPPHDPGYDHPEQWRECDSCREWVAQRAVARKLLHEAGLDPVKWLGPSDQPEY